MTRNILLATVMSAALALGQEHGEARGPVNNGPVETPQTAPKDGQAKPGSHAEGAAHEEHGDTHIVWKWVNFGILAAGLGYLARKHIGPYFQARNEEIQKSLTLAAEMKRDAEVRAAAIEQRMVGLQGEVQSLRGEARAEIAADNERRQREMEQAVTRIRQQAQAEIESAAKGARHDLQQHAARLALTLAEQRIKQRLTPATQDQLVSSFTSSLQEMPKKDVA